jgi:hypothetical protein
MASNYATFKEKNGGSQAQLYFTVIQNTLCNMFWLQLRTNITH